MPDTQTLIRTQLQPSALRWWSNTEQYLKQKRDSSLRAGIPFFDVEAFGDYRDLGKNGKWEEDVGCSTRIWVLKHQKYLKLGSANAIPCARTKNTQNPVLDQLSKSPWIWLSMLSTIVPKSSALSWKRFPSTSMIRSLPLS